MIYLATGLTKDYLPRARSLLESADKAGVPFHVFTVNFISLDFTSSSLVDYPRVRCQLPKFMLQNGNFVDFAPAYWTDEDVIIFCDADAIIQRPFTATEIESFVWETRDAGVMMGRNKPDPSQTLEDEAAALFPQVSKERLAELFPGYEKFRCYNTGFVIATLGTWKSILGRFAAYWASAESAFQHYAMVQFTLCYVLQNSRFKITEIPLSIHGHGHHGLPKGVEKKEELWRYQDEPIAYAHAL